ncbi:hypothetical protein MMC11_001707 [Xylographa trunciseda]|nr:hypothetical protein [Xylographa trunciseda]
MNDWWTDDKIGTVVNSEYVFEKLGSKYHAKLHLPLAFGQGLTNDTYLDWIVSHCKRLFLTLDDIGCPENIFKIIDKSLDDSDLPIADEEICELDLTTGKSTALDKKFFRRQFHFVIQELGPGKHVDYRPDDIIPVKPTKKSRGFLSSDDVDKVCIEDSIYIRRRMNLSGEFAVDKVHFVMHFKTLQRLQHPHLLPVWSTYTQGDYAYVLLGPTSDTTLKSFLEDPPKQFKGLDKPEKRDILIRWVHCLTDAVAYLHESGYAHQSIRPSNIFIDDQNKIFLGEYAAMDALEEVEPAYKKEAYEYEPPEKWQRKPIVQEVAPLRTTLHGGGRTKRRLKDPRETTYKVPSLVPSRPRTESNSNRLLRLATDTTTVSSMSPDQSASIFNSEFYDPISPVTPSITPTSPIASTSFSIPNSPMRTMRSHSISHTTASKTSTDTAITAIRTTVLNTFSHDKIPDPYPSDIFSLATIHLHLLTSILYLASSSISKSRWSPESIREHLGKLNVTAGRGGAPPDCSFHVNLRQASTWLDKLEKEANGRSEATFFALSTLIGVVRRGLARSWQERHKARDAEREVRSILVRWSTTSLGTCCGAITAPPDGFTHRINTQGDVEMGHRRSDGAGLGQGGWLPSSPPLTNSPTSPTSNEQPSNVQAHDAASECVREASPSQRDLHEDEEWPLRSSEGMNAAPPADTGNKGLKGFFGRSSTTDKP